MNASDQEDVGPLQAAITDFMRELFQNLDYQEFYEYAVSSFDEAARTADLCATSIAAKKFAPHLRAVSLARVAIGLGMHNDSDKWGRRLVLREGAIVIVGFEHGDVTRPTIVAYKGAAEERGSLHTEPEGTP